ncbi:hypothetical protein BS78_06G253700 [Paspalum vaginatum]|nr:hypothetical protein BS78_06G253700 [Paspalum vaginatum]
MRCASGPRTSPPSLLPRAPLPAARPCAVTLACAPGPRRRAGLAQLARNRPRTPSTASCSRATARMEHVPDSWRSLLRPETDREHAPRRRRLRTGPQGIRRRSLCIGEVPLMPSPRLLRRARASADGLAFAFAAHAPCLRCHVALPHARCATAPSNHLASAVVEPRPRAAPGRLRHAASPTRRRSGQPLSVVLVASERAELIRSEKTTAMFGKRITAGDVC